MRVRMNPGRAIEIGILVFGLAYTVQAQSFLAALTAEPNPEKRSEKALLLADEAFDNAKDLYSQGNVHKGDAQLENMTNALNACVASLQQAGKARFYKKAEMKVAYLQRRMEGLLQDLSVQEAGWAQQTNRELDQIHDKLLAGVMKK